MVAIQTRRGYKGYTLNHRLFAKMLFSQRLDGKVKKCMGDVIGMGNFP
jgi:hypothetical protein